MLKHQFSHVTAWVFDLDNTLYPPKYRLFDQIEVKMTDWVMQALGVGRAEANRLRQHYWNHYGTTLAGLMREHDVDPAPYLHAVHDICTHQYAHLSDGYVEDGCIECPLHQGRFNLTTGAAECAPVTEPIKVYPLKVEGGRVMVELAE